MNIEKKDDQNYLEHFNKGLPVIITFADGVTVTLQKQGKNEVRSQVLTPGDANRESLLRAHNGLFGVVKEALDIIGIPQNKIEEGSGTLQGIKLNTTTHEALRSLRWPSFVGPKRRKRGR